MAKGVDHVAHQKDPHIEIGSRSKLPGMRGKRPTESPVKSNREVARAVSAMRHFGLQQI
jgi:hypothetical protein